MHHYYHSDVTFNSITESASSEVTRSCLVPNISSLYPNISCLYPNITQIWTFCRTTWFGPIDKGHNNTIHVYSVSAMTHSPVSKAIRFNKIVTKGFSVVIGSLLDLFSGEKSLPKSDTRNPPKSAIVPCLSIQPIWTHLSCLLANIGVMQVWCRCDAGVMHDVVI